MSKRSKNLHWNVYIEDFNSKEIKAYDVLDNKYMEDKLKEIKKKFKKELKKISLGSSSNKIIKWAYEYKQKIFAEELEWAIQYRYWAKCEYEVLIVGWPPAITIEELEKLYNEKEGHYRVCPELETAKKVDIYSQVMLNWDIFVDYVWGKYINT